MFRKYYTPTPFITMATSNIAFWIYLPTQLLISYYVFNTIYFSISLVLVMSRMANLDALCMFFLFN